MRLALIVLTVLAALVGGAVLGLAIKAILAPTGSLVAVVGSMVCAPVAPFLLLAALAAFADPQLAGFLFYQVPGSRHLTISIESRQACNVVGTVFLPNGTLDISADRPVADRSAYTIIVADELRVRGGPTLTLNTDYFATDVPVPVGVGPGGITIVR